MLNPLHTSPDTFARFSPEEQFLLRPLKSAVLEMEVMVKFHRNVQEHQIKKNPFVSWTLNKVAVIDRGWLDSYRDNVPIEDLDWWRVKIEHETSPGQPVGCFVVRPLWKVPRQDLTIFPSPTTWTMTQHGLTILLYPRIRPWMPWIIPKALRSMVMRKTGGAALIIPLSYPPEGAAHNAAVESREIGDLAGNTINDPEVLFHGHDAT